QQPPAYPQQPPAYPQQPPVYNLGQQPPAYPQQPPVYNQGQQPYPQQPAYLQQQPPKKSNKGWIIGCGIAAVVLLLVCGGVVVALYIGANRAATAVSSAANGAAASTQAALFCTDYMAQEYGSAYTLLSSAEQGRVSQSQFTTSAAALDTSDGQVATCDVDPNHPLASVSSDGKSATVKVQVARGDNANLVTGTITLVYENSEWKIDSADGSLKLF
ncbi:MAG: hypothetical protein ACM3N4_07420, partial [Nitrososphaerota archaeon]